MYLITVMTIKRDQKLLQRISGRQDISAKEDHEIAPKYKFAIVFTIVWTILLIILGLTGYMPGFSEDGGTISHQSSGQDNSQWWNW